MWLSEDLQSMWLLKWDKVQWILSHFFNFEEVFYEYQSKTIMQLYIWAALLVAEMITFAIVVILTKKQNWFISRLLDKFLFLSKET